MLKRYLIPLTILITFSCGGPEDITYSRADIALAASDRVAALGEVSGVSCSTGSTGCDTQISECVVKVEDVGLFFLSCRDVECDIDNVMNNNTVAYPVPAEKP